MKLQTSLLTVALVLGTAVVAKAETGVQVSKYDFDAIYNGVNLNTRTVDLQKSDVNSQQWLNDRRSSSQESSVYSDMFGGKTSTGFTNSSSLSMPAIPGTSYGTVNVSGSKWDSSDSITARESLRQNSNSRSDLSQYGGSSLNSTTLSDRKQDLNTYEFGSGNFVTGQTSSYFKGF